MSAAILPFKKPEPPQPEPVQPEPHMTGPAVCMSCKEKWTYVAAVGTTLMECPGCSRNTGVPAGVIQYEQDQHCECVCGSQFFCRTPDAWYCPSCGIVQGFE